MKKAAIAVLFLAGAVVAAGESGKMGGFGNFISDVQAEDERDYRRVRYYRGGQSRCY